MFRTIRRLLARSAATPTSQTTRLGVEGMEDRLAPALITNPGTIRGFNPQPEPPREVVTVRHVEIPGINVVAVNP